MAAKPAVSQKQPTLKAWLERPESRERLEEILVDPVFLTACHFAISEMKVLPNDLVGPTPFSPEGVVRKAAMAAGAEALLLRMKGFLVRSNAGEQPKEWEHILPKE